MKEQITPEQLQSAWDDLQKAIACLKVELPMSIVNDIKIKFNHVKALAARKHSVTPVSDEPVTGLAELRRKIYNLQRRIKELESVTPVLSDADIQKEAKRLSDKLCLKYRLIRIDFRDKTEDFFLDTAKELAEKNRRIAELESHQLSEQEIKEVQQGAWPLTDVLKKLQEAAKILLDKKNYDGHGWEEIYHCIKRSDELIAALTAHPHTEEKFLCLHYEQHIQGDCVKQCDNCKEYESKQHTEK